ncbi:hypothetical protein [Sporosarcina sp. A2]|uniref:hypothetical protein n=1 Tax=Sporosarcina sp. A2 TaxID=3393449 RepID=UPI003D7BA6BD
MEKYSVYILFKNGRDMQFETVENPLDIEPIQINGIDMVITKDKYVVNLLAAERIEVVEIGNGLVDVLTAK